MKELDVLPKEVYHERAGAQMERHLAVPTWTIQQKMALACRILAAEGHESGLDGQISARASKPGTYYMLQFGLGFDEATASSIVTVDDDLNVLAGDGMVNPSNRFHLWLYRTRPGVNAIIHTHPPHVSALSMIGQPLVAAHMDTSPFYNDCAYLSYWPGVPIGDEEGKLISEAIGDKRTILLAHHGQLSTGANIEEAAFLAFFIERTARLQLLASSAGTIRPVGEQEIKEAHDYRLRAKTVGATFAYLSRRILRTQPETLE